MAPTDFGTGAAGGQPVVTADNFIRVESDAVFTGLVAQGGVGKFYHNRDVTPPDNHVVQRPNRDTLYSTGVFDLDAGPVTITLPDAGTRYLTMIVIDEDHYVFNVIYGAGRQAFSKDKVGTRYAVAAIRILVDPNNPKDVERVHALQDAVQVEQPGGPGTFEVPNWDPASHKKVREALTTLGETIPDWRHAAGRRGEVDEVRHLIVTATGWGLNPDKDAIYLNVTPGKNDGKTVYRLNVKDVPVDGFWSISLYNKEGYFEKNNRDAYTLNNVTAAKDADGSVTIQFGGSPSVMAVGFPDGTRMPSSFKPATNAFRFLAVHGLSPPASRSPQPAPTTASDGLSVSASTALRPGQGFTAPPVPRDVPPECRSHEHEECPRSGATIADLP